MAHIAVLGAGSWGTALAVLLCRNGHSVTLWSHRKEHADSMRKTGINEKSFPGIRLPETLDYPQILFSRRSFGRRRGRRRPV